MTPLFSRARSSLARGLAWQSRLALVVLAVVAPLLALDLAAGGSMLG